MQIVFKGDNLYEMSKIFFRGGGVWRAGGGRGGGEEKILNLSSAELARREW